MTESQIRFQKDLAKRTFKCFCFTKSAEQPEDKTECYLKMERKKKKKKPGVLDYMAFLKGQDCAENLHKMIKLFKFPKS